jgi:two-component system sensor histidine kinase PilS (NtrC family)
MSPSNSIMDRRTWLRRLIWVRVIVFSVFVIRAGMNPEQAIWDPKPDMQALLAAVFGFSVLWFLLLRFNRWYVGQAYAQILVDLLLITWGVNRTGVVDSYFSSLYFLVIVMSSILLERRGAFLAATLSSVIHFTHMEMAYFELIPSTELARPDLTSLQYIISLGIFGFCSVGFLSNFLAESWRKTGAALEKSTGQVAFLQAFSDRIFDSVGSGLITADLDGRIYLFNRSAENITGSRLDEVLRMTVSELFPGVVAKAGASRFEAWTKRRDGRDIYLRFSVLPVMIDNRNTAGYVWCFDDLTELRLLERQMRQKEQMAAIGVMSAGIAHEIRNPLASITGSFKMLQSDLAMGEDQRQLVDIISREAERLNRTITGFLHYARPLVPQRQNVDLAALISETVSLLRNSPELKPTHSIETELDPITANVDESMMRQVFYNLASNAFKAMPTGGALTIGLSERNGGAQIRFTDTGVGLAEDELKSLFVPFHSAFRTGTGLGLPIVYQIVNAHNGVIGVKSRKGAGTTFFIDLQNG